MNTTAVKKQMITCGGCSVEWTGDGRCHCSGCHNTFGGLTSFDAHRTQYGERGSCKKPEDIGLIQTEKGVWSAPFTQFKT